MVNTPTMMMVATATLMKPGVARQANAAQAMAPLVTIDYRNVVSAADIYYTGLTPKPYHGMPIGTGEMGSLVWNSGTCALKCKINRTDVFGCNSAVTAVSGDIPNDEDVTKVVSDFGYGCGFVTLDVGGNPLPRRHEEDVGSARDIDWEF